MFRNVIVDYYDKQTKLMNSQSEAKTDGKHYTIMSTTVKHASSLETFVTAMYMSAELRGGIWVEHEHC
jgi:hypothetical protein